MAKQPSSAAPAPSLAEQIQMRNSNTSKIQIPDTNDTDLFSDEFDSSDDEADVSKMQRQDQNSASHLRTSLTDAIQTASENAVTPKTIRRERIMKDALERVKNKESAAPTRTSKAPSQPRRKRTKLVIKKGEKTKVKMNARKSIVGTRKLIEPTAVYDQQRCVIENGEYTFRKIEKLVAKKGRGRGKMRVHKVPDPTCPIRTNAKKSQDKSNQAKDQSLLDCVGVYLTRLGWSERARRTQYQLNLNGSLLIIPRDRMLRIVTDMHIHGELDEFTAGRIEEELLISKVERQIQVSTMVKNSYQNAQYDNDNVNQRITGRRKHDDQYHFDVSSDNCDVDHPRTASNSPPLSTNSGDPDRARSAQPSRNPELAEIKFICAKKCFPKFYGDTEDEIFAQVKVDKVRKKVLRNGENTSDEQLVIEQADSQKDHLTMILHMTGREDLVRDASRKIVSIVRRRIALWNSKALLEDKDTIEVDVNFNIDKLDFGEIKGHESLWIPSFEDGSQFREVFGAKAHRGAAITEFGIDIKNLESVSTRQEKEAIVDRARQKNKQVIIARVCIDKNEDLSSIDVDRFVKRGGNIMPRYRNDDTRSYRGRWKHKFHLFVPGGRKNHQNKNTPKPTQPQSHEQRRIDLSLFAIPRKRKANGKTAGASSLNKKKTLPQSQIPPQRNTSSTSLSVSNAQTDQISKRRKANDETTRASGFKKQKVTPNSDYYKKFTEKMKPVMEIEFRSIHKQSIKGILWAAHKKNFGNECNENCRCASQLEVLTKDVVSDYVSKKSKEEKDFKLDDQAYNSPGFAKYFCPKFIDFVRSSFPNDSSQQILSKLIDMWQNIHTKTMRFGSSCSDECPCLDGWTVKFLPHLKGDDQKKGDKKKKITVLGKLGQLRSQKSAVRDETMDSIFFRPANFPLGFYCVTRNRKCVVASLSPTGSKKLSVGTTIEAYQIDQNPEEKLESHQKLQEIFEILKARGGNPGLKLFYLPLTHKRVVDCKKDWKKIANTWVWIGSNNSGWAGGAMVHGKKRSINSMVENNSQIALGVSPRHLPEHVKEKIHAAKKKPAQVRRRSKVVAKKADSPPKERAIGKPAPKILRNERNKDSPKTGNTVKFDLSKKTTHTWEIIPSVEVSTIAVEEVNREPVRRTMDSEILKEYLMCKSVTTRDLIRKLKESYYDLNTLKEPLKKIKETLNKLDLNNRKAESQDDLSSEERRNINEDYRFYLLRSKAIKIFEIAHIIIGGERAQRDGTLLDGAARFVEHTTPGDYTLDEMPNLIYELENERKSSGEKLCKIHEWINRFQMEKDRNGQKMDLGMDFDIDRCGVSLVHAAVIVGEVKYIEHFIKGGAKQSRSKGDVVSPLELAKLIKTEAMQRNNVYWIDKYEKVITALENSNVQC